MNRMLRYAAQGLAFAAFAATTWYLSVEPRYSPIAPGEALLKISFSHQGQRLGECRQRSAEELADLAPNMRTALDCPRERAPIYLEVELDDARVYQAMLQPTGLSRDGSAYVYERLPVPAGVHRVAARLRDSADGPDFDYSRAAVVQLAAAEVLVVDFDANRGGFLFKGGTPAVEPRP